MRKAQRRGAQRRGTCPATGKRRFRDHREAPAILHRVRNVRRRAEAAGLDRRRPEARCYGCESCHGWHLTSWEQPDRRRAPRRRLDPEVFELFVLRGLAAGWVPA
jgi:hypothetical protein